MKQIFSTIVLAISLMGCATAPKWSQFQQSQEDEYKCFAEKGPCTLTGQAFLTQRGGGVVKAAGRDVTLDPATSIGADWYDKAGRFWKWRNMMPPSEGFKQARKTTIADAEGRFKFTGIRAGKYFLRTSVTWEVPSPYGIMMPQGGLVGKEVIVEEPTTEVVLSDFAQ